MRTKFLTLVAISILGFAFTGCVSTVDNGHQAGMPFIKDRIVRLYERPVLQVWAAAKDVLNANGTIVHEDVMQSTVTAHVDTKTVRAKVESLDAKTTRVTLQVRTKSGGSDIDLAGQIAEQIAIRLATGTLPTPLPASK